LTPGADDTRAESPCISASVYDSGRSLRRSLKDCLPEGDDEFSMSLTLELSGGVAVRLERVVRWYAWRC
jgi:hypothetical protein